MSVVHVSYLYTNLNVIGIVVLFLLTNSTNFLLSPRIYENVNTTEANFYASGNELMAPKPPFSCGLIRIQPATV